MKTYDVIVIGSGGGTKIAGPAAALGKKVALIENDDFGGTCLNRGCIPSKMLIAPSDFIHESHHAETFNVNLPEPATLDFPAVIQRTHEYVTRTSKEQAELFASMENLDLVSGSARFIGNNFVEVEGERLTAPKIIIATGSRPSIPNIPGLTETPYMTSREALKCNTLPRKLIVLGGGYIGCELGHVYGTAGSDVHFLVRSELLRPEDKDIREVFQKAFAGQHTIHRPVTPLAIHYENNQFIIDLRHSSGASKQVIGDALLVATGVIPNTDTLGLDNTDIETDAQGYIKTNEYLETSVPDVFALGDCNGHYLFRHSVNFEGEYVMNCLFDESLKKPINYGPVPHAVFTYPEIAGAGFTEDELIAQTKGLHCWQSASS